MESADEIFADGVINPGFAADAGVDHGQKRGGNLHEGDAAEDGGGDEADDIADDTAAEGEDGGGAFDACLQKRVVEFGGGGNSLVVFPGGHFRSDYIETGFH